VDGDRKKDSRWCRAEFLRVLRPVVSKVMNECFADHIQKEKLRLSGSLLLEERKELEQRHILTELRLRAAQKILDGAVSP